MEQNEFDDKIKYAQNIINILQTRLNESIAQNVQLEATVTILKDDKDKLTKELADGNNKTKKEWNSKSRNNGNHIRIKLWHIQTLQLQQEYYCKIIV